MMTYKMVLIGAGGQGRNWCQRYLPPNVQEGLVQVVAAADINPDALANAQEFLGLRPEQCYTDTARMFRENPADFCVIVTPPAFHEAIVDLALEHNMHILSEKPIADTLLAAVRVAKKVASASKKMGVTMSHRFDQDKTTFQREVKSGRYGALDYLVCRLTCDLRKFASWGKYRHEMADPELIEAAGHRLDILADLAGANCSTIYCKTWRPAWAEYVGDCQSLAVLTFANGVNALYESTKANAVGLNGAGREYIRAECKEATLILNNRRIERFSYDPARQGRQEAEGQGEQIALLEQPKWANTWLLEKFVRWLDGGEPMETDVERNVQAVAMTWAGIESSRSGRPIQVQEFLEEARRQL